MLPQLQVRRVHTHVDCASFSQQHFRCPNVVADGDEEQEGKEAPQTKMLNGNNVVPLIHVDDLGSCVAAVAASPPEDLDYIVAVDEGTFTIRDITSSIAGALNSGAIRDLTEEETAEYLLANSDDATAFEKLSHNLKFKTEDAYIHSLSFDWVSKEGIVASIDTVVEQFKVARNLTPLKVVMIGPPSLPKQMFASRIAKKYYLPLLSVKDLVNEASSGFGSVLNFALIASLIKAFCFMHTLPPHHPTHT